MESGEGFSLRKAFVLAGAIIALVVGTGFATGQELVQYFTAYGLGGFAVIAVFAALFIYYNLNFAQVGARERYERGNDVFRYYCGKRIGAFFDYYSTLFCYLSFFVMVGGASSALQQGFGIPAWAGATLLTIIVVLVVSLGLKRLIEIIGVIGPINIAFFIMVGLIVVVMDWPQIADNLAAIQASTLAGARDGEGIVRAGEHWLVAGLSYAGFVLLWFASFMTLLGAKNERRTLRAGLIIAVVAICAAIAIIFMAQVANINTGTGDLFVWNAPIPNLILAERIWPPLAFIYAVVVFIGACATSVPLLYNPVARFAEEGTLRFRVLAAVLGVTGLVIGLFFPYRMLVNVVYVVNGYIGAVLLIFMVVRTISDQVSRHCDRMADAGASRCGSGMDIAPCQSAGDPTGASEDAARSAEEGGGHGSRST